MRAIYTHIFSINILEKGFEICENLKITHKLSSLEIPKNKKRKKKLGCHECIKCMQILVYFIIYYHKICTDLL